MLDSRAAGFSLVEVLVAMVLVAGAVAGLASLGIHGATQSEVSHRTGLSLSLAQGKLDELRAAVWRFDATGSPVTDPSLALSSALTLTDGAGAVDLLDRFGQPVTQPSDAAFRRRWSVTLFDVADPHTILLQACVESLSGAAPGSSRQCVATVRTRHP